MTQGDKYLVVISILEGRNFPKRSRHQLIAEARFDGELLATDPIDHGENPDFTQELAWELDKKGLHQHRMQRSSIKIQIYAVDTSSTAKEAIGYVLLDIRTAKTQQVSKWLPLLHGKYSKEKPDIRVGIYIDDDKGGEPVGLKPKEVYVKAGKEASDKMCKDSVKDVQPSFNPSQLKPSLNEVEGFYQLGPEISCNEIFIMSVTITFASNLPHLVPTSIPLPTSGFFFYYTLLGNDVTNDTFNDLLNPSFPAERASVKIRSSAEALQIFFDNQPGLQIHLCCGEQSLGSCEIPLKSLIKKGSTEIYMKPLVIENAFQLHPPNRTKQQMAPIPENLKPLVGVSISLRKEELVGPGTPSKDLPKVSNSPPQRDTDQQPKHAKEKMPEKQSGRETKTKEVKTDDIEAAKVSHSPSAPPTHNGSYTDTFEARTESNKDDISSIISDNLVEDRTKETTPKKSVALPKEKKSVPGCQGEPMPALGQVMTIKPSTVTHAGRIPHHFCCSIDLQSFRLTQGQHQMNVFVRYSYPFFGSAAPIMTHPVIQARKGQDVLLPQSFCAFDFATSPSQLQETFTSVPLVLELWDREKSKSQNVLFGATQIVLASVFAENKTKAVHSSGISGWRQVTEERLAVMASNGPARKIGELNVTISLEDWGPLNVDAAGDSQPTTTTATDVESRKSSPNVVASQPENPRDTQEYKAALELEMWKEKQETAFQSMLKNKEQQYMKALAEEWKKRDKEREILVQKKLNEYSQLEEKLKKTLADLDKRDKQLGANEQEVLRLRTDLQREHERKMTEMREASRRMKEDCDHQIQLEKSKNAQLLEDIARLKQQICESDKKYQTLDKEFLSYKDQQRTKPEVQLHSEINLLTLEKVELERKLETVTKSKVHYKQQWGRALKELARLKLRQKERDEAQLRKEKQELEHLRLRFLASEEKEVMQSERKQLEDIRNELNMLKEQELAKAHATSVGVSTGAALMQPSHSENDDGDDEHITRLVEERDTLLRTGVYTNDDRIIAELDRQIREAISNRNR